MFQHVLVSPVWSNRRGRGNPWRFLSDPSRQILVVVPLPAADDAQVFHASIDSVDGSKEEGCLGSNAPHRFQRIEGAPQVDFAIAPRVGRGGAHRYLGGQVLDLVYHSAREVQCGAVQRI